MKFSKSARAMSNRDSVVALCCFDGVHIGHSEIISRAVRAAQEQSLLSVVWSFQAPPKSFFAKENSDSHELLTTLFEKKALIRNLGVDFLVCAPFNEQIASLTPREFCENIIIGRLRAKHIFCGFNYRFGHKGSGDIALLRSLCDEYNIALTVIDEIRIGKKTVSSSAIRNHLLRGEIAMAEKMLGRKFSLRGKVIDGQHLGRTLGFPTINQEIPRDKILIKNGVYLTQVRLGRTKKYGITNIGMRPTVNGKAPICETHILDFCGDLYGKQITVEFLEFLRSERKFDSLDELSAQVSKDIEIAKQIKNKNKQGEEK